MARYVDYGQPLRVIDADSLLDSIKERLNQSFEEQITFANPPDELVKKVQAIQKEIVDALEDFELVIERIAPKMAAIGEYNGFTWERTNASKKEIKALWLVSAGVFDPDDYDDKELADYKDRMGPYRPGPNLDGISRQRPSVRDYLRRGRR